MKKTAILLSTAGVLLSGCAGMSPDTNTAMRYTDQGWTYTAVADKDWTAAERVLRGHVDAYPNDSFAKFNLGLVYAHLGRNEEAMALFVDCAHGTVDHAVQVRLASGEYKVFDDLAVLADMMVAAINSSVTVRDVDSAAVSEPAQSTLALVEILGVQPARS